MKQLNWYQIFGNTHKIPDGATVLPTDDIQIWLHCANIWDKAYTTLAEVLADTTTLAALIASNNAVDYMVRSTTWATIITVPAMTSYTTPSGRVTASTYSTDSDYLPWKAFAQLSNQNGWVPDASDTVGTAYIQYEFADSKPVAVTKLEIKKNDGTSGRTYKYKFSGSNDGINFTDIATDITLLSNESKTIVLNNTAEYIYHRVYLTYANGGTNASIGRGVTLQFYSSSIPSDSTAMSYIGLNNYCANTLLADSTWCEAICNSEYFESVLNVKVPVMTSNTTPSGEAFGTAKGVGSDWYLAFDGTIQTGTVYSHCFESAVGVSPAYIGYKFSADTKVCMLALSLKSYNYSSSSADFSVEGSDNDTYTSITTATATGLSTSASAKDTSETVIFASNTSYKNYIVKFSNGLAIDGSHFIAINELQFYGREDV